MNKTNPLVKLRYKFREAIKDWPHNKITDLFQKAGIKSPENPNQNDTRNLIDAFFSTMNFTDHEDVEKLKRFFESVLYEIPYPDHDIFEHLENSGHLYERDYDGEYRILPMIQPMFEDSLSDKYEKNPAYGMIDGWCTIKYENLPRQYKQAADTLVQQAIQDDNVYKIIYPVCFLYRHAIELFLKCLITSGKSHTHSLKKLLREWSREFRERYNHNPAESIIGFIEEFQLIDNDSIHFRYFDHNSPRDEQMINLPALQNHLEILFQYFERDLEKMKRLHNRNQID